ncbi:MAG: hypothetical protein WCT32_03790 [Patescibacteria group bacterium]
MAGEENKDELEIFVDRLIEESPLSDLDEDSKFEARKDLREKVEEHIHAALLAATPPEKIEELSTLLSEGDGNNVQQFLQRAIPDITEVTAQALINFRMSYLGY